MVVLAAKRAANKGKRVIVVSSKDTSDDLLCSYLESNNVNFFRGSLDNTLERFINALSKYKEDTVVHRLTADNVFPDGDLINELEKEFLQNECDYMVCNGVKSGLPYGLSVETFRLSTLREAYEEAVSSYDLEHVTPYIAKNKSKCFYDKYLDLNLGNYSCTIDTYSDYLLVSKIFGKFSNPESISWKDLIDQLKTIPPAISKLSIDNKLVLGTVQFGMHYGINNISGQPSSNEVKSIIKTAIDSGVKFIDTARNYGNSENLLGRFMTYEDRNKVKISTKLSSLVNLPNDVNPQIVRSHIRESIFSSCINLSVECIDYLLLHRVEDLFKWENTVMESLLELKQEGFINKIGASVQNADELNLMLDNDSILLIQMPYNILDRRWDGLVNKINKIKKQRELIVHIRSVFLQGLLLTKDKQKWHAANVNNPSDVIGWLEKISSDYGNNSLTRACLAFVRSQNWIDGIVIGVDTINQMQENLEYFSHPKMKESDVKLIINSAPSLTKKTLDPSNWSK
jgi:aryl-alcohol dehydrogenase-like predicted oxidoreductase/spore coat polysaccharide biosynthesis protein SpsF (cytidylyltransferase family)